MSTWNRFAQGSALAVLAAALVAPTAIYAQETTGTIRGQIASAGSNVAGAEVVIVHTPSGSRATTRTDARGQFATSGLRAGGPYTITVSAANLQGTTVNDVFLTAAEPFALTLNLEPAADRVEVVVVTASAVGRGRVDGSATGLRRDRIEAIVTPGRDIRELARQSPLVTQNTVGDGGISIAGSNPRTNRITIDGVAAQDDFGLNTGGLPTRRGPISLDAVSQFNVTPAPFDVRNGGFLGGAIDIVLRSGDNKFGGSVFGNFLSEDLTGASIKDVKVSNAVDQTNYGATLRGPIIKDRLFFALAYEKFEGSDTTNRGPIDGGSFANTIVGPLGTPMTLAEISAVTNVFKNTYASTYDFGSIPGSKPILDEKYSIRLDWNITDKHRAQFTYRNAESTVFNFTNLGATTAALDSMWYFTGEADSTYSVQLNSDWTERLQTEARISYRDYTRLQEPPGGQNFSDVSVCSTPTSLDTAGTPLLTCGSTTGQARGVVRFGADQFRHANFLATTNTQGQFEGRYRLANHLIKGGFQWQEREIFNLFVPNSDGTYYFDSIAAFSAGQANRLQYSNNPSGDPNKAAAEYTYQILATYLQDTWTLTDDLRVTAGLRNEVYSVDDKPALNANFVTRNGFDNQQTYDGLSILMPRASFSWNAPADIRVSGGIGLFSGGLPDVFLSNSFSNTGVLTVGVDIQRNADGTFREANNVPGFTQAIGATALNGLVGSNFGRAVPASVLGLLGGITPPPNAETNSLAKDIEIPSEWKINLAANGEAFGLRLGVDLVYNLVDTGYAFRDLSARPLIVNGAQALTPDGRRRYDGLTAAQRTSVVGTVVNSVAPAGGAARDIQLYNPSGELGTTFVAALSASKSYDWGLNWSLSYTFQNIDELSSTGRFSSTASSLYANQFSSLDPEQPTFGRGQEEIENVVKYSVGWRGNAIGDLETRIDLFGDVRAGRPINWVMGTGAGRSFVTGVNKGGILAYIPDMSGTTTVSSSGAILVSSDARVAFDSLATFNSVQTLVTSFGLPQGGIIPRGYSQNDQIHLVDVKLSQQLPGLFKGHKSFLTFDISNFLNMLNEDWGVVQEYNETQTLFTVACADATGSATPASAALTCNRYRITNPSTIITNPQTRNIDRSRWQIQVGLKYEF
jgi:Carboxypeptidase regulatory-like domain